MINDAACTVADRWKYVDDLTFLEVISKNDHSTLQTHVDYLTDWCRTTDMKPNPSKCKSLQISFLRNRPPLLELFIDGTSLQHVPSFKLLGVTIQSDLKWDQQVKRIITDASRWLFILSRLKKNGVATKDLVSIYKTYILPVLEFGAVVWSSSISQAQSLSIERVQKRAMRLIAYPHVLPYTDLLDAFNMHTLSVRRNQLIMRFGNALLVSERHRHLLPLTHQSISGRNLRNSHQLNIPYSRTQRYKMSPIPFMSRLLNNNLV